METIIKILINAGILVGVASIMPKIEIKNFGTAVLVALFIGILNFFIGWLLTAMFNIATLGVFYFVGMGMVTRTLAYATVIKIVDKMTSKFNVIGFLPALILAVIMAIAGTLLEQSSF